MGTRGLFGIRKGGIDKAMYNHYDSYPDWLGRKVLDFIAKYNESDEMKRISKLYDRITLVNEMDRPSGGMLDELKYLKTQNDNGEIMTYYEILHCFQGDFEGLMNAPRPYMTNDISFIHDSLFCEYAYIINLDEGELEFYLGFQKKADPENRYGTECDRDGYYPCRLADAIMLESINKNNVEQYVSRWNDLSEKEYENDKE